MSTTIILLGPRRIRNNGVDPFFVLATIDMDARKIEFANDQENKRMNFVDKIIRFKIKELVIVLGVAIFWFFPAKSYGITPTAYCATVSGCEILNIETTSVRTDIKYCKANKFKLLSLTHSFVGGSTYFAIKGKAQPVAFDCSTSYYCVCADGEIKSSATDISGSACDFNNFYKRLLEVFGVVGEGRLAMVKLNT